LKHNGRSHHQIAAPERRHAATLVTEYVAGVAARGDATKPYQHSEFCEL
jgi:hypothetical protein